MRRYWARQTINCAVFLVLAVTTHAQTAQWSQYSYSEDGFAASYPSPPDLQKKTVQTSAGEFEMRSYTAQSRDTALIAAVCDYGAALAEKTSDQVLLGAKNSTLSNSASRLLNEKKITLDTNPGLQFEAENSTTHFTVRIYLAGTTLYQVLAVSPINKPFEQTARFLDSFQFITRAKPEPKD